jgi:peroxiredoxin
MNATKPLAPGNPFPSLSISLLGDERLELPQALAGHFSVVLVFRGAWCPYCNAQLRGFERARDRLEKMGVRIVAFSTDGEAATRRLVDEHRLRFPVGHSADAMAVHAALGSFLGPDAEYVESTGFVLGPDGRVIVSVYSSGAIGRLHPDDVIGLIGYLAGQASAAA